MTIEEALEEACNLARAYAPAAEHDRECPKNPTRWNAGGCTCDARGYPGKCPAHDDCDCGFAAKETTRVRIAELLALVARPLPDDPAHPHIVGGEFQSDKYPTTPRGKVPLSVKDKTAQDLLWEYAQRRRSIDAQFADDLERCLRNAGYAGAEAP